MRVLKYTTPPYGLHKVKINAIRGVKKEKRIIRGMHIKVLCKTMLINQWIMWCSSQMLGLKVEILHYKSWPVLGHLMAQRH